MTTTEPTVSDADTGRSSSEDLEAILLVSNTDVDEAIHVVEDNADAIFTWDYEKGARPALNKLYEKAKVSQWNGETDLPWDTEVDPEKVAAGMAGSDQRMPLILQAAQETGSPLARWSSAIIAALASWSTSIDQSRSVWPFHWECLAFS